MDGRAVARHYEDDYESDKEYMVWAQGAAAVVVGVGDRHGTCDMPCDDGGDVQGGDSGAFCAGEQP